MVAIAFIGAIAYGELVLDWRIPRSDQTARTTMRVSYMISLVAYNKLKAETKEKYGDRAQITFDTEAGFIEVKLDSRVIERREEKRKLEDVFGIFVIGPNDAIRMRFPFALEAGQDIKQLRQSLADSFKHQFDRAPKQWLEFTDKDWTIDRCVSLPSGLGLGSLGDTLRLREGTACVVTWKGPQSSSMLIGVNRADGDPWMRPFIRRLCRGITEAALKRFDADTSDSPKYAACILADRPDYVSAQKSLAADLYSVGPGNALARMNWGSLAQP